MPRLSTHPDGHSWRVAAPRLVVYDVVETTDLFDPHNLALLLGGRPRESRRFVVVDDALYAVHHERIRAYFEHHGLECHICPLAGGEAGKSFGSFFRVARALDAFGINRRSEPIIAIGGGVLLDVVSFAASCYRRGVPCVRVPTTLMAYVDAAIGIKTGVNFDGNKNRMGSFSPPHACLLDRRFFQSLPRRHLVNGVGEIVKLAVVKDSTLFELLEREGAQSIDDRFQTVGEEILRRAITGMLEELEPNLYEDNLERCVDYGHTFSPMLEMVDLDGLLHGEAVAVDVAFSAVLAERRGLITEPTCGRILSLVARLGLPLHHPQLDADLLWKSLLERRAHRDGYQRVPLPAGLGRATFVNDITPAELARAADELRGHARALEARHAPDAAVNA